MAGVYPMSAPWLVIQHVAWEGPGLIAEEATRRGITLSIARMDLAHDLPAPNDLIRFGGLIVMGGPMSVNDERAFPNLAMERRLLAAAVETRLPVLGVCLGAQLLAAALGTRVYRGTSPEVGFGEVRLTPEGSKDPVLGSGASLPVFHWHEETFDLPSGAALLASTELYPNQAFRVEEVIYGFQFHVELNAGLAEAWVPHLPSGVLSDQSNRTEVECMGRRVIGRFLEVVAKQDKTRREVTRR